MNTPLLRVSPMLDRKRHRQGSPTSKLEGWFALALAVLVFVSFAARPSDALGSEAVLDLAGEWQLGLDRKDEGIAGEWFRKALPERIRLPGSLPASGFGDAVTVETVWTGGIVDRSWFTSPEMAPYREPGKVKVPFWLQPETQYVGAAWYRREVRIPEDWKGRRIVLFLERPHWETRVWLDGVPVGKADSLGTPHELELGVSVAPGAHTIAIRVDNRLVVEVGADSHSVTDHTQGNWNGIVGRLELRSTSATWIDDLQVYPRVSDRSALVRGTIRNAGGKAGKGRVVLAAVPVANTAATGQGPSLSGKARGEVRADVAWTEAGASFEVRIPLGPEASTWDEFRPVLHSVTARLDEADGRTLHERSTVFGIREIGTEGTQFALNGRKIFIRGTLECCIFPLTGHPPMEKAYWTRMIRVAKAHGLNLFRFHSWCPPEAAFAAADELGFYYQVECSSWCPTLGDGKAVDAWLHAESERMRKAYGNHPSFLLLAYGNEPGGPRHPAYLADWVTRRKAEDPRRLYTSGSGWPQIPENQFHVTPDPRVQAWGGGLGSRINAKPPETCTDYREYIRSRSVPVLSHEIGQWCVYPNLDEIPKYTGYLKAKNFEIFRDALAAHGMLELARPFLLASGKLQALCYKEDIESALRTPGMGGFQLLDLHDFPGQGTALVGVLDPFWDSKGYVTPEEYHRFSGPTVPLARLAKRVFTAEEELSADIELAHFGPEPLRAAKAVWRLASSEGKTVLAGELAARDVPIDNAVALGSLRASLASLPAPRRYTLAVGIEGQACENDWDLWVYPPKVDIAVPAGILIARELDEKAERALAEGGKVLLLIPPARVKGDRHGKVALGFSSIFWNTAWTGRQAPHTLGILCDPAHPALASFPTEFHSNWQWWYILREAGAMILDELPGQVRPIVQVVDDWFTARKLGLAFEAKVGGGKLLVASIELEGDLEGNPVVRQLRASLLAYMGSALFDPAVEVPVERIRALSAPPSAMERVGARIHGSDGFEPGYGSERAIDGDPRTMWHTPWTGGTPGFPHSIEIECVRPAPIRGLRILPRQDGNPNGWIREWALYLSEDGKDWGLPVLEGTFPRDAAAKELSLKEARRARFLRLVALSGHAAGPWASIAEVELLLD